jgi:hypothetical protein
MGLREREMIDVRWTSSEMDKVAIVKNKEKNQRR